MTLGLSVADQDGDLFYWDEARAPEQRAEPFIRTAKGHQMLSLISQSQLRCRKDSSLEILQVFVSL